MNSIEVEFKSMEGLKTIISDLDRPIVRMINRWAHPYEKYIVKLRLCFFTTDSSYTTCENPQKAICAHLDFSLP